MLSKNCGSLCVLWLWALKDAPAAAVTMHWHSDALENLKYFTGEKNAPWSLHEGLGALNLI